VADHRLGRPRLDRRGRDPAQGRPGRRRRWRRPCAPRRQRGGADAGRAIGPGRGRCPVGHP
jgi:hypothetical protein